MARLPSRRSSRTEIDSFLSKSKNIATVREQQPRLFFAIDATASRQPTWDQASHLQREMFLTAHQGSTLSVQLCYFRGFAEFHAAQWTTDSEQLAREMARVYCEGGHTQIERLLRHALTEHQKNAVKALVFIGDAMEENADTLCQLAGQCGLRKLPIFIFQEGQLAEAKYCFTQMAKLSKGAWASFDTNSSSILASLLGAVAGFATGGLTALERQGTEGAKLLLEQLKH
ncbi:MAG: VWA domain-containing protein [Halioglobus sp.]